MATCHGREVDAAIAAVRRGEKEVMLTTFKTFVNRQDEICAVPWHAVRPGARM